MSCRGTQRSGHGLGGCCSAPGLVFRCVELLSPYVVYLICTPVTGAVESCFEDSIGSLLLGLLVGRCLDFHTRNQDFGGHSWPELADERAVGRLGIPYFVAG